MEKKHHFSNTTVRHHKDGSHTITHHHESGDEKRDLEYAVADHDAMMDGMHRNLSPEMTGAEGEGEGEAGEAEHAFEAGAAGGAGE